MLGQLRAAGIAMNGRYPARPYIDPETQEEDGMQALCIGWTTDRAKADAARTLGATVTAVRASDERFSGWEVSINVRL